MFIYRVEHKITKDGPYNGKHEVPLFAIDHNDDDIHLSPKEEIGRDIKRTERCGFRIKQDYKKWFDWEEREALQARNFHLVKYKVPRKHVTIGILQLIFKNSKGIRVKSFDCVKTHLTIKDYLGII